TLATTGVTNLSTGSNIFRWIVPGGVCEDAFDEVEIFVQQPPSVANAGPDQSICSTSTTLEAVLPTVGSGTWEILSGTGVFADSASNTTLVSALSPGDNVFR